MFVAGNCIVCDKHFVHINSSYTNAKKNARPLMCCSDECREHHVYQTYLAGKRHRRAMERSAKSDGEKVQPYSVYSRDRWICQICNEPIDRQFKWPHKMSVTLDHIIPLAKGGEHTYRNLQCAHLVCNSRKSDKLFAKVSQ